VLAVEPASVAHDVREAASAALSAYAHLPGEVVGPGGDPSGDDRAAG